MMSMAFIYFIPFNIRMKKTDAVSKVEKLGLRVFVSRVQLKLDRIRICNFLLTNRGRFLNWY